MTTKGLAAKSYDVSPHAQKRLKERGLLYSDIEFIMEHGIFYRCRNDRTAYLIPKSPFAKLSDDIRFVSLQGVAVILGEDLHTIVTIYYEDERSPFDVAIYDELFYSREGTHERSGDV